MGLPFLRGMITKDIFLAHLNLFLILYTLRVGFTFLYSYSLLRVSKESKYFLINSSSRKEVLAGALLLFFSVVFL
jgi:hypothetical protein